MGHIETETGTWMMVVHVCEDLELCGNDLRLTSLSCPESRSSYVLRFRVIMGSACQLNPLHGRSLVSVLPWIPLYPDRDDTDIEVVATQLDDKSSTRVTTRIGVEYMQVLTTLSQTGISLPHLALLDIQTYSILHLCVYEF